jgi:hypothetical protein
MTVRTYSTPEAFKQALEQRLRTSEKSGAEMARRRQLLVFERFLARIVAVLGDAATLKGGLALECRLERARTTKDIDLRMMGSPYNILAKLQEAGRRSRSRATRAYAAGSGRLDSVARRLRAEQRWSLASSTPAEHAQIDS